MKLELDDRELLVLRDALRTRLDEMMRELVRTEQRPYRKELRDDVRAIEILLARCEQLGVRGPEPIAHA